MKNKQTWILLLLWAAMVFLVFPMLNKNKQVALPKPEQLLQKAEAKEKAAGNDKDKLGKAIKEYEKLVKIKQLKNTEPHAEARLRIAIIREKLNDHRRATADYTSLKNDRRAPSSIRKEAEERLTRYETATDKKNSVKPGYKAIDWLVSATGRSPQFSYAFALILISVVFKLVTTPLSHAQFKSMKEMQKVAPLVKQIQAKYKGNQQEIGKRTMDLYKEHGINPLSGCLPLLLQMPILMGLYYWVIVPYTYQFSKGEFLWIGSSLADRWPAIVAANLALPDIPLLVIYTISMIVSQKLSVVDASQAEQQKIMAWMMPIMFAFIFKSFPSALMLYWLAFTVIGTIQQYKIMKHPGAGGPAAGPAAGNSNGGDKPVEPVKRPPVRPGRKSKGRKRRFDARPIAKLIPEAV